MAVSPLLPNSKTLVHRGKNRPDKGHIHVWRMQFSSTGFVEQAWRMMSDQERARASSFRFSPDRERYCKSKLLVRCVLGRYLGLAPAEIVIVHGPYGKPSIDGTCAQTGLHFNLAHCKSIALLAVAGGQSVGVDVEDAANLETADVDALSQQILTKQEARTIHALSRVD
jgi:4'-phosphopantetheinyl transferase